MKKKKKRWIYLEAVLLFAIAFYLLYRVLSMAGILS